MLTFFLALYLASTPTFFPASVLAVYLTLYSGTIRPLFWHSVYSLLPCYLTPDLSGQYGWGLRVTLTNWIVLSNMDCISTIDAGCIYFHVTSICIFFIFSHGLKPPFQHIPCLTTSMVWWKSLATLAIDKKASQKTKDPYFPIISPIFYQ